MRSTWNLKNSSWTSPEQKGCQQKMLRPYGHLWRLPASGPAADKACNNLASIMDSKLSADLIIPKWWLSKFDYHDLKLFLQGMIINRKLIITLWDMWKPVWWCGKSGQDPMRPRLKSTLIPRSSQWLWITHSLLAQHTLQSDYFAFPKRWHIVARKIFFLLSSQ